ncbi:MAG: hypothetical protein IJZ89_08240 [Clostridia bacterium]|nr:hypothetical protein [Clostridia bacterium]
MTERTILPYRFAPMRGCGVTYDALLRDRKPCAISEIIIQGDKSEAGRIGFYATPMGTAVEASLSSLPFLSEDYEPCFLEIEEKRNSRYRNITANLPPIFTRCGEGRITFLTDRFSARDVIGKRITVKKNGNIIASGVIFGADRSEDD